MIIDFHTHTFPTAIAPHALDHMQSLSHNAFFTDGTVSGIKNTMQEAGVTHSVILPVATNPDKVCHINDLSIKKTGKDGLIFFGCMHPAFENYYEELGRIAQAGIKGIKIHPLYQQTDITDIRYLRILERAAELGLIVVMHSGEDPAFPGEVRAHPKMTRSVLDQVGPIKLVCAHMGGLFNWDEVPEYLLDKGVYIDTGFALGKMAQTEEHFYTEEQLQLLTPEHFCELIHIFGKDRVLFGTDSPWARQKHVVDDINALPLSEDVKAHIFYRNAQRLLNLPDTCSTCSEE